MEKIKSKKRLLILILGLLVLLVVLCIVGWYILTRFIRKEDVDTEVKPPEETKEEIFDEALENYTDINLFRAEGEMDVITGGQTYTTKAALMSKDVDTNYLKLEMEEEHLHIYTSMEDEIFYVYMFDGEETVRFELVEHSIGDEIYDEVVKYYPSDMIEDLETEGNEQADIQIEYIGEEACHDMNCHKYKVTDTSTGQPAYTYLWIDTDERLPRIVEVDSEELKGKFDIYYKEVKFDLPEEYEDIDIETFLGIQKLYRVAGDFVDLLI